MKQLVVFILLIIVMAGSMSYCCPADDCADEQTSSSSQDDKKETGNCSPFVTCGSCGGFVQMAKTPTVIAPLSESPIHHAAIFPFLYSTYFASFFQPPKHDSFRTV